MDEGLRLPGSSSLWLKPCNRNQYGCTTAIVKLEVCICCKIRKKAQRLKNASHAEQNPVANS